MSEVLIRGYKAKEQIEEIIKEARYGSNNCMIGEGLEIIELPPHGDLIDRDATMNSILGEPPEAHYPVWYSANVNEMPVVIPASEEAPDD